MAQQPQNADPAAAWTPVQEDPAAQWKPVEEGPPVPARAFFPPGGRIASGAKSLASGAKDYVVAHPAASGAMALGTAASVASGGLALPAAAGLTGLAGAGGAGWGLAADQLSKAGTQPPPSIGANVKTMAEQGALQAGGEVAGRELMAGAKGTAKWLVGKALDPTEKLAREFPEMAQTAIDHAITVSKGGYEKAQALLTSARDAADSLITQAEEHTADFIHPHEIAAATADVHKQLGTRALNTEAQAQLGALTQRFINNHPTPLSLTETQALKRSEQKLAERGYRAVEAGTSVNDVPTLFHQAIARGARETLESRVPGLADANIVTKQLLGVTQAAGKAVSKKGGALAQTVSRAGVGATLGGLAGALENDPKTGAAVGGLAGATLGSPHGMSRLAILLAHPIGQAILKQLPRATAEAILGPALEPQSQAGGPPVPPAK